MGGICKVKWGCSELWGCASEDRIDSSKKFGCGGTKEKKVETKEWQRMGGCGLEFLSLEHLEYVLGQPCVL